MGGISFATYAQPGTAGCWPAPSKASSPAEPLLLMGRGISEELKSPGTLLLSAGKAPGG